MATIEREDSIQLIGFHVGDRLYGADILGVQEILRDPDIETLSKGSDCAEGIVRLRGDAIPVIQLDRHLGYEPDRMKDKTPWLMVAMISDATLPVGFEVDGVTRIINIQSEEILPAPDLILDGLSRPYIRGVCNTEAGMLVVLDFERILAAKEIDELKKLDVR